MTEPLDPATIAERQSKQRRQVASNTVRLASVTDTTSRVSADFPNVSCENPFLRQPSKAASAEVIPTLPAATPTITTRIVTPSVPVVRVSMGSRRRRSDDESDEEDDRASKVTGI